MNNDPLNHEQVMKSLKILIFGAGVIGSVNAVHIANAGYDVTVFARSERLQFLRENGLLYNDNGKTKSAKVKVIDCLGSNEIYDFVFVTVRYEQILTALADVCGVKCDNIVTMVNNPFGYADWEEVVGKGRLIPAFTGAGGRIEDGVLYYQFAPKFVQATTCGELSGAKSERIIELMKIFNKSKIPYSFSKDMDSWQKSHLALVTPLANGFYFNGGDKFSTAKSTAKNKQAMRLISSELRRNFRALKKLGISITPGKMNVFRWLPLFVMEFVLKHLYNTQFAIDTMESHANNAREEMQQLNEGFLSIIN